MTRMVNRLPDKLYAGTHDSDSHEMCVMEAVAWVAGEKWTDHPKCACPVLTSYAMVLNDRMPDDKRQALLPYVVRLVNTRNPALESRRAYMAADRAVRVFAPLALDNCDLAGLAGRLRSLDPLTNAANADAAADAAAYAAAYAAAVNAADAAAAARAAANAANAAYAAAYAANAVDAAAAAAGYAADAAAAGYAADADAAAAYAADSAVNAASAAVYAAEVGGVIWTHALVLLDDLLRMR